MSKTKNDELLWRSRKIQVIMLVSILMGILIGAIGSPLFFPSPVQVEHSVITVTPALFGSPQVDNTFISSLSSATPNSPDEEQQFISSIPMCSDITRSHQGQFIFRIWLQQSMELFRLDEDGNNLCQLTNNTVNDDQPAWAPDGERIAFVSSLDGYGIYLMNPDGTNIERLTTGATAYSYPAWSPDGNLIIFQATIDEQFDIYSVKLDGSDLHNLTNQERLDTMPAWSPDGRFIAFVSDRIFNPFTPHNPFAQYASYDIYMMDADGLNARRLTVTGGSEIHPSWSPDGQQIAFVSKYWSLYRMQKDGSGIQYLTAGEYPVWLPDGEHIAFVYGQIYSIRIDGTDKQQISNLELPPGSGIVELDYTPGTDE